MLKITIDNEEVVSNKDFTIEEEMLNTPSVILNNVYPKTWEATKDYTTNFYHPNDYSKCLITDETDNPGEPGSNVSGSSFNINVDTNKEYSFKLTGQNGVVSGRQDIIVASKNMFDSSTIIAGDIKGANTTIRLCSTQELWVEPGTYTFSTNMTSPFRYTVGFNSIGKPPLTVYPTYSYETGWQTVSSTTFTTTVGGYLSVQFSKTGNATLTVEEAKAFNWQLERGSSATTYEEYNGITYKVNLGKNVFDGVFRQGNQNFTTTTARIFSNDNSFPISNGETYTISTDLDTSVYSYAIYIAQKPFLSSSNTMLYNSGYKTTSSFTFTSSYDGYLGFTVRRNNEANIVPEDVEGSWFQLEKGNYATTYAEYFTPIKLEATTDEIYKSGNKWYTKINGTTTEITNNSLKSTLNNIRLINGVNNVSIVSPYLPLVMDLHYNYITPGINVDLLFCGVVKNSGYISLNPRDPHYQTLQILDFKTFLSEGETLDFVIADKTIEEAIDQVISTIAPYGFVKGNINILGANTTIGAYSTKDKTAYDVFNYLADITQSRWTTRLIDENTVAVDFYDPTLLPQGTAINYTTQWFTNNKIDDMSYSYGSNDYRNKQVMTSNEVYGSILQTQTIVANGYQTQFDTELKIGSITSITANGTQLTVATNEQKDLGYSADIYYSPGNNYFESADLMSTGEIIIINYIAIVEGRQIITNGTEITRVATATGRKGVVARYENRNDATTSNELQLIGQSYIKYKGVPEIKLTITSRSNLWNIGDRVQFNAPITELDTEYMVKKKTINRVLANPSSEETIFYTFELTSSFNSEQAINYFDNQRAKARGNIGAGEYITRNVDIESNANIIFYDNSIEEVSVDGDNQLNSILNSPFNS